jgi:hypothetical protein
MLTPEDHHALTPVGGVALAGGIVLVVVEQKNRGRADGNNSDRR